MSLLKLFKTTGKWEHNLKYYSKTLTWLIGNAIFGLGPLLFMYIINTMAEKKIASDNIEHQIRGGTVLFVCSAVMGSIFIDFFIGEFPLKGIRALFIYGIPPSTLVFLLLNYLLIYLKIIDNIYFNLYSNTSKIVIVLAIF